MSSISTNNNISTNHIAPQYNTTNINHAHKVKRQDEDTEDSGDKKYK